MSETFPFGEDAPVYDDAGEADGTGEANNRKALFAVGGVAAALLVAGGAYLLLGGGGSDDGLGAGPVARGAVPRATSSTSARPTPAPKLPATFKEALGRDPFRALYLAPVAAPAASAAPQPSATAARTTTSTTITTGMGTIGTTTSTGGTAPPAQVVVVTPPTATPTAGAPATAPATTPSTAPARTPASPTAKEYAIVFKGVSVKKGKQYGVFTIDGTPVRVLAPTDPSRPTLFGPTNELGLADLQRDSKGRVTAAIRIGESGFDLVVGQTAYVR